MNTQNATDTRPPFEWRMIVRGLAWDVGMPMVGFYVMFLAGVSVWVALLTATSAAAARVVWVVARDRMLNMVATLSLLVYGVGLAMSFISGDARFLLLKSSVMTATVAMTFLVTAALGRRPLTLAAEQSWAPDRATEIAEEYRTDPDVRHRHRVCSTVWGLGMLAEAIGRIPLIYLLPIPVMVGLSTALLLGTIGVLLVWNVFYVKHWHRRRTARATNQGDGALVTDSSSAGTASR